MTHQELVNEAIKIRERAYAPYSQFQVGAALLAKDGRVFPGVNVENMAYGLTNCAERTAFFSAIAAGLKPGDFEAIAVVGPADEPIAPCGGCRQVMVELGGPRLPVIMGSPSGIVRVVTAESLLPGPFKLPQG